VARARAPDYKRLAWRPQALTVTGPATSYTYESW
jgi:hypothetical protein